LPYYEIIYETGTKSVAFYGSDAEAQTALKEHNDRALRGEPGTPAASVEKPEVGMTVTTWPAERIKKVLVYKEHPGNYMLDGVASTEDVKKAFDEAVEANQMEGLVHVPKLVQALLLYTDAAVPDAGTHDSMYKMQEDSEYDLGFLSEGGAE